MEIIFWISAILIVYAYIGYPTLLFLIHLILRKNIFPNSNNNLFKVTILISAYNEEENIEKKLDNTLSLIYPPDLLEIIVISDGSTDKTDSIVESFADRGVILKHYPGRIGKTACLNRTIPLVTGEIIVFSDANSIYHQNSIQSLVKGFIPQNVGFVTGHTRYINADDEQIFSPVGLYSAIEAWTKNLEGAIGSCVSADGAIFAIRKTLYKPLKDYDINDFVIPLNIIEQGYRGLLAQNAFCYENTCRSSEGEFARQVRITNRTLRAIFGHRTLLNPYKFPLISFQLVSHKLLKFFVPFFLLLTLFSNIYLVFDQLHLFYVCLLLIQLFIYSVAFKHPRIKGFAKINRISQICRTFIMVNWAIVHGWIKLIKGETYTTWNPTR
jgi:cellulose synthase/poly-beta-1,6-N-acetylglucosamine synthase-like glycosyltransferase